ncbi:hypothetical protein [Litoribacter populi]|uniref:hypothetical protein n=1 Tax=Litoribacter populi TaxID=2598460 RepID=UPI00117DE327|nr:hypothetical protein [Litoribacter populi]
MKKMLFLTIFTVGLLGGTSIMACDYNGYWWACTQEEQEEILDNAEAECGRDNVLIYFPSEEDCNG